MSNEIKIKSCLIAGYDLDIITLEELHNLSDYITNLQKENRTLKELNACVGCNNNPDYKSRIDKAVEYIKEYCIDDEFYINLTNKEKHIIEVLNILQSENNEKSKQLIDDYKSRVDKAIELLKNTCYSEEDNTFYCDLWKDLPELLRILKGGD